VGTTSAATLRKEKELREAPQGTYVDPARYRGKEGHALKKKEKKTGRLSPGSRKKRLMERAERTGRPLDTSLALTYTDDEKFALMYLCIRSDVRTVSQQEDIPENTIYGWFRQVGGIDKVRTFVASKAEVSFYNLIDETAQEIRNRLEEAPTEELFETFRKMMDVADRAGIAAPERRGSGRGESGGSPGHPGNGGIVLNFNPPASGDAPPPKDAETKVSVFDE